MEKFLNLPIEKQNVIIDAAFTCFGTNGYKKASINDIATASGISKAMVFHYFGTKKALYLYSIEVCGSTIMNEVNARFDAGVTDFFDKIMLATDIEMSMLKKHPAILSFLNSIYFETDSDVKADVQGLLISNEGESFRQKLVFENMDASKFKDGVDPKLVLKMLTWMGYGYMNTSTLKTETDLDAFYKEFKNCVQMLKNNFYKEEYLRA
ncbi:MAG TPA: TetR/AcrR family transcriptional regulator [Oscillospiraceae bacterium]|nr:TetR/AcrR family transcriptional regulator [Oscillospiraceae bacterium]